MKPSNAESEQQRQTAYRLWLTLGLLGAHRFYLDRLLSGGLQLSLALVTLLVMDRTLMPAMVLGLWWLLDMFLITGYCRSPAARQVAAIEPADARKLSDLHQHYQTAMLHRDFAKAIEFCDHAMDLVESTAGKDNALAVNWHVRLADAHLSRGAPTEAVVLYNHAIGVQERLGDHAGLCHALYGLAQARLDAGQPETAESAYRRLLELQTDSTPDDNGRLRTLIDLSRLYTAGHRPHEALPLLEDAARLAAQDHGATALEYKVRVWCGQAAALTELERPAEAQELYERAISLLQAAHETAGLLMADCRYGLGVLCLRQGRIAEADKALSAALDIREKTAPNRQPSADMRFGFDAFGGSGPQSPAAADPEVVAAILFDLVTVAVKSNDPARAMMLAGHWRHLQERIYGVDHPKAVRARARIESLRNFLGIPSADHPDNAPYCLLGDAVSADSLEEGASAASGLAAHPEGAAAHGHDHPIVSVHTLDGALHIASRVTGQPKRAFASRNGGLEKTDSARSVLVPEAQAMDLLDKVRDLLPWDFQVFIGTTRWQVGEVHPGKVELVVIQSGSALDALRTAATAAPGLTTAQLLGCLQSWDNRYGLDIVTAESDEVGFCLLTRPDDMDSFYRELLAFCPALRASLPGPEALAARLADLRTVLRLRWYHAAPGFSLA